MTLNPTTTHQNRWDAGPSRFTVTCVLTPLISHMVRIGPPAVAPAKGHCPPVLWYLVGPPTLPHVYVPAWMSNCRYPLSLNTRSQYEILKIPQPYSPCQGTKEGRVGKSRISTSCGT